MSMPFNMLPNNSSANTYNSFSILILGTAIVSKKGLVKLVAHIEGRIWCAYECFGLAYLNTLMSAFSQATVFKLADYNVNIRPVAVLYYNTVGCDIYNKQLKIQQKKPYLKIR